MKGILMTHRPLGSIGLKTFLGFRRLYTEQYSLDPEGIFTVKDILLEPEEYIVKSIPLTLKNHHSDPDESI